MRRRTRGSPPRSSPREAGRRRRASVPTHGATRASRARSRTAGSRRPRGRRPCHAGARARSFRWATSRGGKNTGSSARRRESPSVDAAPPGSPPKPERRVPDHQARASEDRNNDSDDELPKPGVRSLAGRLERVAFGFGPAGAATRKAPRPDPWRDRLRGGVRTHAALAAVVDAGQQPRCEQQDAEHRAGPDTEVGPIEAARALARDRWVVGWTGCPFASSSFAFAAQLALAASIAALGTNRLTRGCPFASSSFAFAAQLALAASIALGTNPLTRGCPFASSSFAFAAQLALAASIAACGGRFDPEPLPARAEPARTAPSTAVASTSPMRLSAMWVELVILSSLFLETASCGLCTQEPKRLKDGLS